MFQKQSVDVVMCSGLAQSKLVIVTLSWGIIRCGGDPTLKVTLNQISSGGKWNK